MPNLYVLDNPKQTSGFRSDTKRAVVSAENQARARKALAEVADNIPSDRNENSRWLDPERTRCWFLGKSEMPAGTVICHERFG